MQWSTRTRSLTIETWPELKDKVKISGGVGFDYYKIVTPISKDDFLHKYKKNQYTKIIGFGCWNFGVTYPVDSFYESFIKIIGESGINRFQRDRDLSNQVLLNIIEKNPDILFLL